MAALDTHAAGWERIEIDRRRMDGYWSVLHQLWGYGEAFLIVEHDIVIHEKVVPALKHCPRPWCLHPYWLRPWLHDDIDLLTRSLGCTRFSRRLLTDEPDVIDRIGQVSDGLPFKDWRRVDTLLWSELDRRGYAPHVHMPPVGHLHDHD